MKKVLILLNILLLISCNTVTESPKQAIENKETIERISNDLKLMKHNVFHARKEVIEIFNDSPSRSRRRGKDTKPLGVLDGLNDINKLIIEIEMELKSID